MYFFFFQAEDGIRDRNVTGVQTCALPISELGESIIAAGRGLVAAGLKPGDRVGIFLHNSWEFCVACHAITLAGGIPSPLNPSSREREVCYQVSDAGASLLITNGPLIAGKSPEMRAVYTTRVHNAGTLPFADLLRGTTAMLPQPAAS